MFEDGQVVFDGFFGAGPNDFDGDVFAGFEGGGVNLGDGSGGDRFGVEVGEGLFEVPAEIVVEMFLYGGPGYGCDVVLEVGDHEISEEIRELNLGRVLMYGHCPQAQGILTPVIESFAA